jgi:hypothetical protein
MPSIARLDRAAIHHDSTTIAMTDAAQEYAGTIKRLMDLVHSNATTTNGTAAVSLYLVCCGSGTLCKYDSFCSPQLRIGRMDFVDRSTPA